MLAEPIALDDTQWPIVRIAPQRRATDGEVTAFASALEQLAAGHDQPFAIVLDARQGQLEKPQRKIVAAAFSRGAIARNIRGEAVVVRSPLLALLGRLMMALMRPKLPMAVFVDAGKATRWAEQQVAARG